MYKQKVFILFLFFAPIVTCLEEKGYLKEVEYGLQKFCDMTNFVTEYLEDFNDRHIGNSEWGRMMGYEDIKPKIRNNESSRGMKKMSMAMMPLVFHVGATSTWMMLTSIMAVKSVAIGLLLLVFKVAVSSAKIASFFTLLKSKHIQHETWHPHGHFSDRSINEIPTVADWNSYTPELSHNDLQTAYKTVPSYTEDHPSYKEELASYPEAELEERNLHIDPRKKESQIKLI